MRRHWPLAAILLVAAALVTINLGRDHLWADEGDTAVLAASILDHGVPTAWDGVTFSDADYGKRLTDDFVMVSHPWLQYYLVAGSFALFGETAFAARLPFALLALATIALVYVLVLRASESRLAAASSAILLTLSVQFLLYARQSRNYTLNAALTCLLVLQFTRLIGAGWPKSALFALTAILLFHSHPIGLVPVLALALLTIVYAPFRVYRRGCWLAMPAIAAFTLPWLVIGRAGYSETTAPLAGLARFFARLGQFGVETASVTSLVGIIALVIWLKRRQPRPAATRGRRAGAVPVRTPMLSAGERGLAVAIAAIVVAYAGAMALTQSRDSIWTFGMRYTPAVIAFGTMLAGMLIAKASRGRWQPWLALMLVFGFTKLGRITPWTLWAEPTALRSAEAPITFHVPPRAIDAVFRTGQIGYIQSLFDDDPGTTGRITDFLRQHAAPSDIVVTNYAWEPIYFHTQLPQGMKVLPSYPIYAAARDAGLPPYVFGADGVRWIVWRQAWGNYRGHDLAGLLDALDQARVRVTRVATIPETLWENRENVHFRRFPDNRYLYAWYENVPDAMIFRVDW
jgi:4-amino-4-deoxy-L-arabinose transferase-like glycosyltransferase